MHVLSLSQTVILFSGELVVKAERTVDEVVRGATMPGMRSSYWAAGTCWGTNESVKLGLATTKEDRVKGWHKAFENMTLGHQYDPKLD